MTPPGSLPGPPAAWTPGASTVVAPRDYPALEQTLNRWLRPSGPRLGLEYPLLFRSSSGLRHLAIHGPRGEPLAHAALLVRRILRGEAALPVAMVSCVATRPEARGRGLGSRIVSFALEQARELGAAAALLWSDREAFYGRLGFRRSGRELVFSLAAAGFPGAWPRPVRADSRHLPQLLALHARAPIRMERSAEDLAKLLQIPGLEVLILEGRTSPDAYLCIGKGLDFPGVVHEIGGEPAACEALLGASLARTPGHGLGLLLPPWETDLARTLLARGFPPAEGALGLASVLDWQELERFTGALGPLAAPLRGAWPFLPFHLGGLDSV